MSFDGERYGQDIVDLVRTYVERECGEVKAENAALRDRLAALESREPLARDDVSEIIGERLDADNEEAERQWKEFTETLTARIAAVEAREIPEPPELPAPIDLSPIETRLAALEERKPTSEEILPFVDKAFAPLDAALKAIDDRLREVLDLPAPISIKSLLIDRNGHLVATLSDGSSRDVGRVVGKRGRDGIDLTSFDAIVLDDDRTVQLKFVAGENEYVGSFKWPTILDRGAYRSDAQYERGDAVTYGGCLWIAQVDNPEDAPKFNSGTDNGWRLAVKKGRDGKDAERKS